MPRFCRVLLAMAFAIVAASHGVFAFDLDQVLTKGTKAKRRPACKVAARESRRL